MKNNLLFFLVFVSFYFANSQEKTVFIQANETGRYYFTAPMSSSPIPLDDLREIKKLFINGENALFIPKDIIFLKELEDLQISAYIHNYKPFNDALKKIGKLPKLYTLGFIHGNMEVIPKNIGKLKNVRRIIFDFNKIKAIPQEIGKLKKLTNLHLTENSIEAIPKEIGKLKKLEVLNLFSNDRLCYIPKEIGKLQNLRYLNLSGSIIEQLPKEITNLKKLAYLSLVSA